MKLSFAFLTAAFVLAGPAHAGNYTVFGAGTESCGTLVKADRMQRLLADAWISGFLTGINGVQGSNLGKDTDATGRNVWIENWCQANPLETLSSATSELAIELMQQKKANAK
jgi:hypothetical protein